MYATRVRSSSDSSFVISYGLSLPTFPSSSVPVEEYLLISSKALLSEFLLWYTDVDGSNEDALDEDGVIEGGDDDEDVLLVFEGEKVEPTLDWRL